MMILLRLGYHQVRVVGGDEPKTTCVMRYGVFEWLVMPIFHLDQFVAVYLDGIIVYNLTLEKHVSHLWVVLKVLRVMNFYIEKEKCLFAKEWVHFLGHVILRGTLSG